MNVSSEREKLIFKKFISKFDNMKQDDTDIFIKEIDRKNSVEQKLTDDDITDKFTGNSDIIFKKEDEVSLDDYFYLGDYYLDKILDEGFFGKIVLCTSIKDFKKFVLKIQIKMSCNIDSLEKELSILHLISKAKDPFLLQMHDYFQTKGHLMFVCECLSGGSLKDQLIWNEMFSKETTIFYSSCILIALNDIHRLGICHGDLKLQNIALDSRGFPKLIDFGHGKIFKSVIKGSVETTVNQMNKFIARDYVKLGKCIYEMLTGERLTKVPLDTNKENSKENFHISPICLNLIHRMTDEERMVELLQQFPQDQNLFDHFSLHPFFKTMNWEKLRKKNLSTPCYELYKIRQKDREKIKNLWKELKESEEGPMILEDATLGNVREVKCWSRRNMESDGKIQSTGHKDINLSLYKDNYYVKDREDEDEEENLHE